MKFDFSNHDFAPGALRWDCETQGCFNKKLRPKIEVFRDCFPRNISFGDVDGIVELNSAFLMLEWKSPGGEVTTGQRIMYQRFSKTKNSAAIIAEGNAETMDVTAYQTYWEGRKGERKESDLDGLKDKIREWVEIVKKGNKKYG
jgi:tricorn protease-like protein|tara:strand:- start:213 stop:644 length:432 start_codon:yes stop_codon:yes gene_type:complete